MGSEVTLEINLITNKRTLRWEVKTLKIEKRRNHHAVEHI